MNIILNELKMADYSGLQHLLKVGILSHRQVLLFQPVCYVYFVKASSKSQVSDICQQIFVHRNAG